MIMMMMMIFCLFLLLLVFLFRVLVVLVDHKLCLISRGCTRETLGALIIFNLQL